ncbi:MAG TPA: ABC transporter ATP-binding protein [Candidatus Avipropionibacterium avicola]|uniref:ABC transporter ATP-binding protein n=1 Tax=Candidatus Avipropionibacterium avicola TaxID=2840701 RepID=A0A9D1GW67_9ACTN|nr:ABC transporter ATP-binding protein [Candidatus Avipropionibacterium avicola]
MTPQTRTNDDLDVETDVSTSATAPSPASADPAAGLDHDTILSIRDLKTWFHTDEGVVKAVDGVDIDVPRGRTMCLVGESGCGKSITARSILGLIDQPGRVEGGTLWWRETTEGAPVDLATLKPTGEAIRRIRGGQIGMVFQEPMASLSPMYTVGAQLVQAIRLHQNLSADEAKDRAIDQLARVGIPQPKVRFHSYPFQLSGGMCQRVMIAIALANDPALLIADEPTTALDVTTQARILDLIAELQDDTGMSVLFITHDLGVVAEIADEVTVMYLGKVAEQGTVTEVFDSPQHPYTRALLSSIPVMGQDAGARLATIRGMVPTPANRPAGCPFHDRCSEVIPGVCDTVEPAVHQVTESHLSLCHLLDPEHRRTDPDEAGDDPADRDQDEDTGPGATAAPAATVRERSASTPDAPVAEAAPLLAVRDLRMDFPVKKGVFSRVSSTVHAVDGVSLDIRAGQTLGLVGESGCGKTTLGRCIARALDPTDGQVLFSPDGHHQVDLAPMSTRELRPYREQVRVIFQDPFSSLNPRKTLLELISAPLKKIRGVKQKDAAVSDQVAEMLRRVGLQPDYMNRYPHAFSGGQRQRINIARALITRPKLVIADEAVSALDVSVRAQILNLLADLQDEYRLTYLFISHDLSVVEHISDRVAVMYLGQIVEEASTQELFTGPRHPYTEALMSAVPIPDPHGRGSQVRVRLADDLPDPANPPTGCYFHTRCPHRGESRCDTERVQLHQVEDGAATASHLSSCHYADDLELVGVTGQRPGS